MQDSILEAVAVFSRPLDLRVWLDATWRREILHPDESFFVWLEWMFPHEAGSKNGAFAEAGTRISGSGAFTVREAKASYQRVSRIRAKPPNEDESGGPPGPSDYEQPGALLELSASYESDGDLLSHKSSHEIWEGVVLAPRQEFRLVSLPLRTSYSSYCCDDRESHGSRVTAALGR